MAKRFHPDLWVSPRPNGIGLQKPNHFGDMAKVAWTNKKHARYAWKLLTKGVCDGCALGVAGLHDWTIDGVHLCLTRLRLLELNCADPLDHSLLAGFAPQITMSFEISTSLSEQVVAAAPMVALSAVVDGA